MFVRGMKESKLQESNFHIDFLRNLLFFLISLKQNLVEIKEVDPTIFGLLLQFLYQGNITVEPDQILSLITLADEYQIRHLIEKVFSSFFLFLNIHFFSLFQFEKVFGSS